MSIWKFQEAKRKFDKVVELALRQEPQFITRQGEKIAVVISYSAYKRLKKPQPKLSEFFRTSPLTKVDLDLEHNKETSRETEKWLGM